MQSDVGLHAARRCRQANASLWSADNGAAQTHRLAYVRMRSRLFTKLGRWMISALD